MKINVIVPVWNGESVLPACILGIKQQTLKAHCIFVDNASSDSSVEIIHTLMPESTIVRNATNQGVAKTWNLGASLADPDADVLVFLNQDLEMHPDCLSSFAFGMATLPGAGILGAKLFYPEGDLIQHAGGIIDWSICRGYHRGYKETDNSQYQSAVASDYVTGACLAIRKSLFDQLNGIDEQFSPAYYEDVDLCIRCQQHGLASYYFPQAMGIHLESSSFKDTRALQEQYAMTNRLLFAAKHLSTEQLHSSFLFAEIENFKALEDEITIKAHYLAYTHNWKDTLAYLGEAKQNAFINVMDEILGNI